MSLPTFFYLRPIFNNKSRQFIGQNTDIKVNAPYSTIITAFGNNIVLFAQEEAGTVLEIINESGVVVTIESIIDIDGAPTNDLDMADGAVALLMYLNGNGIKEKYRLIGGTSGGLTLS